MAFVPWTLVMILLAFPKDGCGDFNFGKMRLNDVLKNLETMEVDRDLYEMSQNNNDVDRYDMASSVGSAEAQTQGIPLAFASYYGDHMVLQQAPKSAQIWGYADPSHIGKSVQILVKNATGTVQTLKATVTNSSIIPQAVWSLHLQPVKAGGPYSIGVQLEEETTTITDVLFGDVWVCSGQSNMAFTVSMLSKGDLLRELATVGFYPDVRLFTAELKTSASPKYDLIGIRQHWSVASAESINGGVWKIHSALCWLYGRRLSATRGYPIGLVATYWGGTRVEAWSSPDALKVCGASVSGEEFKRSMDNPILTAGPNDKSVLWNAMIHPFLNMTIYGAIWYQGESNEKSVNYNCTFPTMISDWRAKFHAGSGGETDSMFPFGFVQLAGYRNMDVVDGFPLIRWQQTANIGYVPNPTLPRVFMAVAMDLPDFQSPYSPIHPRDKETIADRLLLSGLSVAYGQKGIKFQGPFPSAFYVDIEPTGKGSMGIEFDKGETAIEVRNLLGFEVCCLKSNVTWCQDNKTGTGSGWNVAPIIAHDSASVTIQTCEGSWIMGLRYAWRETPCLYKVCAVYSVENSLPVPPFLMNGIFGNTAVPARKWIKL